MKNKRAYVNHQATEEAKDTNGEEMDDNNENGGDDKDSDIEDIYIGGTAGNNYTDN